jgi:hypothetical protein
MAESGCAIAWIFRRSPQKIGAAIMRRWLNQWDHKNVQQLLASANALKAELPQG